MFESILKFWRYGQVVRQWIANSRSPVRIWVPPNNIIAIMLFSLIFIGTLVLANNP